MEMKCHLKTVYVILIIIRPILLIYYYINVSINVLLY